MSISPLPTRNSGYIIIFLTFHAAKVSKVDDLTCTHEPQKPECHSPGRCLVLCLSQMLNMDLEILHHNIHTSYIYIIIYFIYQYTCSGSDSGRSVHKLLMADATHNYY